MATSIGEGGIEALRRLTSAEPPLYLSPSPDLSQSAREASQHIFSSLKPYTPKSPFDQLLTDGFDAEQIWQQIDLQSQPLISNLRREVLKLEKNPGEIAKLFGGVEKETRVMNEEKDDVVEEREGSDELCGLEDDDIEEFDDDDDAVEEEEEEGDGREDGEAEEEDGSDEDGGGVVEDKFLKIKELNRYLEKEQKREYENDEKAGEDEEEDDELGIFGADMDDDEGEDEMGNARYEDFFAPEKNKDQKNEKTFGSKRNNGQKRKPKLDDGSEDFSDDSKEHDNQAVDNQMKHNLSTHEKELQKLQSKIEQMERSNLEPKTWTMQGEVTAAKRPKNSALEVDLDFEHNVRPAPVITEEVTASLEELIKKRILEGQFDDVQRAPSLQSKAPKEHKELDENKSKKGLAEIYEDEYVQKTGLVSTALTFSDEQKKEATMLFKKLCLKLDALSHFHFTPKPVVEDMSINTNVPALAMEEVAPLAVSDAAMLAPEEVYAGKGDIKDETELTQAERKRRRANKKRKYKAQTVKRTALKKARESTTQNHIDGKAE